MTLFILNTLPKRDGNDEAIPVLMYHSISEHDDRERREYYRTNTRPEVFARQMSYLKDSGYSVIRLEDVVVRPFERSGKYVAITFDDGYRDFYEHAAPVLAMYGYTATVFLPTAYIGSEPRLFNQRYCLTWAEVRELITAGFSFGSHTVTHPELVALDRRQVTTELSESKAAIEQELGFPIKTFAYPFAFPETATEFKAHLRSVLKECGYRVGVCTTIGRVRRNLDPLFLWRLPVNSCDDLHLFEAKLSGAYDWMRRPQQWLKRAKMVFRMRGSP